MMHLAATISVGFFFSLRQSLLSSVINVKKVEFYLKLIRFSGF